jgi:hypothetical protein
LHTFGCRVYVCTPGNRTSKLDPNNRIGIFLGYTNTMKNIMWFDPSPNTIKIASHVRFDKGLSDLDTPTPNVRIIQHAQDGHIPDEEHGPIDDPVDISVDPSPFCEILTFTVPNTSCDHPTFGFALGECHIRQRAFIRGIIQNTSSSKVPNFRHRYMGSFIVQIADIPIYTENDAIDAFQTLRNDRVTTKFDIVFAADKYIPPKNRQEHIDSSALLNDLSDFSDSPFPPSDDILLCINSLTQLDNTHIIPFSSEEIACKCKFTRSKLKRLATWYLWFAVETKQLDAMFLQNMFGAPSLPPPNALILQPHWSYYQKTDGTRQARICCNGSICAAPMLRLLALT